MPPLFLHLRVVLGKRRLDAALADGADPAGSPELSLRAEQLTSETERTRLADGIGAILRDAVRRDRPRGARVPVVSSEVIGARPRLIELERRLREGRCSPRGVVMVRRLLSDGTGPVYARSPRGTLFSASWRAAEALEPRSLITH